MGGIKTSVDLFVI